MFYEKCVLLCLVVCQVELPALMYAEVEEEKREAEVATTGQQDGGSHGDAKGKGTVAVLPVWGRVTV
jgi:hypothetical protein